MQGTPRAALLLQCGGQGLHQQDNDKLTRLFSLSSRVTVTMSLSQATAREESEIKGGVQKDRHFPLIRVEKEVYDKALFPETASILAFMVLFYTVHYEKTQKEKQQHIMIL